MTYEELQKLIDKHDDYTENGVVMDYEDFMKLFEELIRRHKG